MSSLTSATDCVSSRTCAGQTHTVFATNTAQAGLGTLITIPFLYTKQICLKSAMYNICITLYNIV